MVRLKSSCTTCINSSCLIKQHCDLDMLKKIDENKITNRYAKHQVIFYEDTQVENICFIHKGIIKVFKEGAFNKDQIIRFSVDGNILGHRGLIKSELYPVSAQAMTDSEVCFISKTYFFQLLNKIPQLSIKLMLFYANELYEEELKLRDMSIFSVREKVAKAILLIAKTFGLNQTGAINNIELLNRQDIAEFVGLTQNQVSKVLGEFRQDEIIKTQGKTITIINSSALEKMVAY